MAWSVFFGFVIGAYALYYVLNILYDLFFSRKQKAAAPGGVHYNLRDLASDEEQPYRVTDEPEEEPDYDGQEEEEYDAQEEEEYDEGYDDEQEQGYVQEAAPEPAPVLKVEGQGIPLDDFLKDAHSYSKTIF